MASKNDLQKILKLLANKDDTTRFVGLVLLKTILDKHFSDLEYDQVVELWDSISPKFLNRLIHTGSSKQKKSKEMLDVAVAVIYTFTKLLNDCAVNEKFYLLIPKLVNAVPHSSGETTERLVDLIHTLVQQPADKNEGGASCLAQLDVDSWTPLIQIAYQYKDVFSIFHWTWTRGPESRLGRKVDVALQMFLSTMGENDPVPLLDFFTLVLRSGDIARGEGEPMWLLTLPHLIKNMAASKQTQDGRRAYTQCAAALLQAYPEEGPHTLFFDPEDSPKPIAYLFVKMVHVDIVATLHILLPKLGTPEYPSISRRIAAALDVLTSFIIHLILAMDVDDGASLGIPPDRVLKLHEDLLKVVGDVMEYLRDRWDVHLAGVRSIDSAQSQGSSILDDPVIGAAIRLIAIWIREDDGERTRKNAASLADMFVELYKMSLSSEEAIEDLRLPILDALPGIMQTAEGFNALAKSDLWRLCLLPDLRRILSKEDVSTIRTPDTIRANGIVHTLQTIAEAGPNASSPTTRLDTLQAVGQSPYLSTRPGPNDQDLWLLMFQMSILELAATLWCEDRGPQQQAALEQIKPALKVAAANLTEDLKSSQMKLLHPRVEKWAITWET